MTAQIRPEPRPLPADVTAWTGFGREHFPGLLGIEVLEVAAGRCRMRFEVSRRLQAPNGYLHGGAVSGIADSACGYGCFASLPSEAAGFTTIELKANFIGTVREGSVVAEATLVHSGKRTQVWDAVVSDETSGRAIALFRCTQMVLYPEAGG